MSQLAHSLAFTFDDEPVQQDFLPKIPDTFGDILQQVVEGIPSYLHEDFYNDYALSILEKSYGV